MDTIESRLARLERQNRWMRRGLICLGLLAVALIAVAAAPNAPQDIVTRRLRIVDAEGKIRAEMAFYPPRKPKSQFKRRPKGVKPYEPPALTVIERGETYLRFYDVAGKQRVILGVTKRRDGRLYLENMSGKSRLLMVQ